MGSSHSVGNRLLFEAPTKLHAVAYCPGFKALPTPQTQNCAMKSHFCSFLLVLVSEDPLVPGGLTEDTEEAARIPKSHGQAAYPLGCSGVSVGLAPPCALLRAIIQLMVLIWTWPR